MATPTSSNSLIFPTARIKQVQKLIFLINGVLLTFIGTMAALSDFIAYQTGNGPLGAKLFNAPYAVSFFELHGLTAFFGILLLTMARRTLTSNWHLAAAAFHLFLAAGIVIFWQGAVAWGVATAEAVTAVLHSAFATAHCLLYVLVSRSAVMR